MADEATDQRVRALRGLLVPCVVLTLLAAAPAWPSEVVQVRVGDHPTFTRVVFEFDAPTGYRVERRAKGEAENAIVVTFDAASRARKLVSRSPGVESVSVEASSDRTVARIVTRQPGLPVKEIILTDPPRVVFDLMIAAGKPVVAAGEPVRQQPRIASPVAEPAPEPEPPLVAEPAPEPEPPLVAEPAPEPESPPVEQEPSTLAQTAFEPEETVEPAVAVEEEVAAVPETARVPDAEWPPEAEPTAGVQRSSETGAAEARARLGGEEESQGESFDTTTVGVIAGGVLALLLAVFAVLRRRYSTADGMTFDAEGEVPDGAGYDGRLPLDGFAMGAPAGGRDQPAENFEIGGSGVPVDEEKPVDSIATGPEAVPGLIDESPEEKQAMTMDNQDLPLAHLDSEAATQLGIGANDHSVGGNADIPRMVQEFERRIAHLETRLNESIDARERLERQVAAQSEELRVQRAAIARTQRALRNMNRTEEDQATEPALRNPAKPAGPQ